jgi:hypothetical protein
MHAIEHATKKTLYQEHKKGNMITTQIILLMYLH